MKKLGAYLCLFVFFGAFYVDFVQASQVSSQTSILDVRKQTYQEILKNKYGNTIRSLGQEKCKIALEKGEKLYDEYQSKAYISELKKQDILLQIAVFLEMLEARYDTFATISTGEMQKSTIVYNKIAGVDENLLSLDVYTKNDGKTNKPVFMWVHGGGWYVGDKEGKEIESKRDFALENGWIFVSVNYRLSPKPAILTKNLDENRVKYPDHNNDIADAITWVYKNIEDYKGNPEKIGLIGHSAGAHLVALAGTREQFLKDREIPFSALSAVASIDIDVYDVVDYVQKDIPMIVNAFGTDEVLNREASPLFNISVGKEYPNFFVAKRGSERRAEKIQEFTDALRSVGVDVTQEEYYDYSHTEIGEAIGADTVLTPDLKKFFKESFQ